MTDGKVLEFSSVTKVFGDVSAVSGLTAKIEPGAVTAVLGPNGAGKTTTLRILLGEIKPTSGTATIGGTPYARLGRPASVVGAVLEAPLFKQRRSAERQLTSVAKANGIAVTRVREVLDLVGLTDVADMRIGSFSLGMRQRLSVAQALLGDPGVLIFDEPANGMDPEGIRWMRLLMRRLADEGRTVVMSSHLLSEVQQVADRLLIISNGTLVFSGGIEELADVDGPIVAVDSPDRGALTRALRENGYEFEVLRSGVNVRDTTARELGELAASAGIALSVLHQRGPSLEDVFLDLVHGRTTRQTAALGADGAQEAPDRNEAPVPDADDTRARRRSGKARGAGADEPGADANDDATAADAADDDGGSLAEGDAAAGVIAASAAVVTAGPAAALATEVSGDQQEPEELPDEEPAATARTADADQGEPGFVDIGEAAERAAFDAADAAASEAFDADADAESFTEPGDDGNEAGDGSDDDDQADDEAPAGGDDSTSGSDAPMAASEPEDRELPGAFDVATIAAELNGDAAEDTGSDADDAVVEEGTVEDADATDAAEPSIDEPAAGPPSGPWSVGPSFAERFGTFSRDAGDADTDDTEAEAEAEAEADDTATTVTGDADPDAVETPSRYSDSDAQDPAFTSLPTTVPIDRVPGARTELADAEAAVQDDEDPASEPASTDTEPTTPPENPDEPEPTTQEIAFDSFTQAFQSDESEDDGSEEPDEHGEDPAPER